MTDDRARLPSRRPAWAWVLIVMCLLIPFAAFKTQWLLGALGLGAAVTVLNISGSEEADPTRRLRACLGVTVVAWIVFILASFFLR